MTEPETSEVGLRASLRAIDDYWFGRGSPTALGIFRILAGTLTLANVFLLGLHWQSWYSEKGYVPDWLAEMKYSPYVPIWNGVNVPRLNLLNGVTDPRIAIPFFCLVGVFAFLTAIGLWTKFSSIALVIGILSIQYRNTIILHGGDNVVRLWCAYMAVSPCGKACSLDRLIGLWRGKIPPGPVSVSLWPQRLVTYNVALIYFTTIWYKFDGTRWRLGIATYFVTRLAEFFRFPYPHFINNLPFVRLTTWATLLIEFSMGTLVFFRPLRKYVLAGGLLMHGWIEYSMNIPLFSFFMCCSYVCFYDGEEIEAWAKRMGMRLARFGTTVFVPADRHLRPEGAAFFEAVDPFNLVSYKPGDAPGWTARRSGGTMINPIFASWSRSIGAWAIAWIPGLWSRLLHRSVDQTTADAREGVAASGPPVSIYEAVAVWQT